MSKRDEPTGELLDTVSKPMPIWWLFVAVLIVMALSVLFSVNTPIKKISEPPPLYSVAILVIALIAVWFLGRRESKKADRNG